MEYKLQMTDQSTVTKLTVLASIIFTYFHFLFSSYENKLPFVYFCTLFLNCHHSQSCKNWVKFSERKKKKINAAKVKNPSTHITWSTRTRLLRHLSCHIYLFYCQTERTFDFPAREAAADGHERLCLVEKKHSIHSGASTACIPV